MAGDGGGSVSQADFDEGIWNAMVEEMTVYSKKEIAVRFFDGVEI